MPAEIDEGEGRPSRWITLCALQVLNWYHASASRDGAIKSGDRSGRFILAFNCIMSQITWGL